MRKFTKNPLTFAVAMSIAATIHMPAAWSQDDEMALEEVMVTARKREESLSETPIAITAITAADIQAGAFKSIVDIQKDGAWPIYRVDE
jgi:iron complex outermembrane receptor protein